MKATGETESTQENIQDLLQLDEGDISTTCIIKFYICFLWFFLSFGAIFCFIYPDYWLIRMTSSTR
jgi:hypothetical protein